MRKKFNGLKQFYCKEFFLYINNNNGAKIYPNKIPIIPIIGNNKTIKTRGILLAEAITEVINNIKDIIDRMICFIYLIKTPRYYICLIRFNLIFCKILNV
ncbi:MAG: hypothetical protein ACTSQP_12450 [Promethearchaeota archaeon]